MNKKFINIIAVLFLIYGIYSIFNYYKPKSSLAKTPEKIQANIDLNTPDMQTQNEKSGKPIVKIPPGLITEEEKAKVKDKVIVIEDNSVTGPTLITPPNNKSGE